jgi:hypothetical protein
MGCGEGKWEKGWRATGEWLALPGEADAHEAENLHNWQLARCWPHLLDAMDDSAVSGGEQPSIGRLLRVSDAAAARKYSPHDPTQTVLYKIIAEHLEPFLAEAREQYEGGLPAYVEKEFRAYLDCGLPSRGFARAVCDRCGRTLIVAFSCKKRGACCASCSARRMYNGAAHIVDHVIPDVPLRQYVLSVPFQLRLLLAARADAFSAMMSLFVEQVFRWQRERAREAGLEAVQCGAVVAQHRGGSSLNLNPHLHAAVPDGVFWRPDPQGRAQFYRLPQPSGEDIEEIALNIHQRFMSWLHRKQLLKSDEDDDLSNEPPERTALEACTEGALGTGGLVTVQQRPRGASGQQGNADVYDRSGKRCAVGECQGYSLYVGAAIPAGCKEARERLLRYCLRPSLSLERLSLDGHGQVVYEVKATRRGKATQRIMDPLSFMARLAALVPPPRHPLLRYNGVFAPHSDWRSSVVPQRAQTPDTNNGPESSEPTQPHDCDGATERDETLAAQAASDRVVTGSVATQGASSRLPRGRQAEVAGVAALQSARNLDDTTAAANTNAPEADRPSRDRRRHSASTWIDWATLMARVWDIRALQCECGGRFRFVEVVKEPEVARERLEQLGLLTEEPPLARARSPTFAPDPLPDCWD